MKSISLLTYTKNEDDDKCEGFKKVSIEIVQGYEYTISGGDACINKCETRQSYSWITNAQTVSVRGFSATPTRTLHTF